MAALFRRHDPAGSARYQELKQLARSQRRILAGTPGTLKQRTQSGNRYWVREHIRVDGRKTDEYLGPEATAAAAAVARLRVEVELAKALAAGSAALRLLGYQRVDRKPAAVLEVLFNRGLFQAGLALVGSHAYGALLNELDVIAPGYKLSGPDVLAVEVLVPGARTGDVVAVKELGAWAQAIPLLGFLIDEPIQAAVLSPNQVIPVNVPAPERFALHKLFSSQSRGSADRDKAGKDLGQAAVLAVALEQETPGTLAATFRAMPRSGKPAVRRASRAAARMLDAHPEAKEVLLKIAAG